MAIENCPSCGGTHFGTNSCPIEGTATATAHQFKEEVSQMPAKTNKQKFEETLNFFEKGGEKLWTQGAYARNIHGTDVHALHPEAICWCFSGAHVKIHGEEAVSSIVAINDCARNFDAFIKGARYALNTMSDDGVFDRYGAEREALNA